MTFIEKKGKNRALRAESARLASTQSAERTIDGHKARSHRILFCTFYEISQTTIEKGGDNASQHRNIKAETKQEIVMCKQPLMELMVYNG